MKSSIYITNALGNMSRMCVFGLCKFLIYKQKIDKSHVPLKKNFACGGAVDITFLLEVLDLRIFSSTSSLTIHLLNIREEASILLNW